MKRIGAEKADSSFHLSGTDNAVKRFSVSVLLEQGAPTISVQIGVARRLILYNGSNVSILQPRVSTDDVRITSAKPYGVNGKTLTKDQQSVSYTLNGREYSHTFLICSLPTDAAGLLGTDFLEKTGAVIDLKCGRMSLTDVGKVPRVYSVPPAGHAALTVFTEGKTGHSSAQPEGGAAHSRTALSRTRPELTVHQDKIWLLKITENIMIAPRCRQIVLGKLETEKGQSHPPLVWVEPIQIPIEGILSACAFASQVGRT